MTKKDLWSMKQDELLKLADQHNIEYDPEQINRKDIIDNLMVALLQSGDVDEAIEVTDDGIEPVDTKKRAWVIMRFHTQHGQPKYVFLGCNGRSLYLPREKLVKIPAEYLNVVREAVENRLEMQEVKGGKIRWVIRKVPTLSYEVLERGVG